MSVALRDYQGQVQTERELRRLQQFQQQRAGYVGTDAYSFALSPTCPPSTYIRFNGGTVWRLLDLGESGFYIPSYTVDLTDSDKVSIRRGSDAWTYIFTNANWYVPCIVVIRWAMWPPPEPPETWPTTIPDNSILLFGGYYDPYFYEYETAVEAEVACREIIGDIAAGYGFPAGCVILRNNGNTVFENQYMPVDAVNRGRSYLFGGRRYGWEIG